MESTETTLPIVDKEALTLQMGTKSTDEGESKRICHRVTHVGVSVAPVGRRSHLDSCDILQGAELLPESFDRLTSLD